MRIKQNDLKTIIESKSPGFFQKLPGFLSNALLWIFAQIVHADELVEFFTLHGDKSNWQFIEAVLAYLKVSYVVTEADRQRIAEHQGEVGRTHEGSEMGESNPRASQDALGVGEILEGDMLAMVFNLGAVYRVFGQPKVGVLHNGQVGEAFEGVL